MLVFLLLFFNWFCLVQSVEYIKPNYTARRLSKEENRELLNTCGRDAALPDVEAGPPNLKIMNAETVEQTKAPWAVQMFYAHKWNPEMKDEDLCGFNVNDINIRFHYVALALLVLGMFLRPVTAFMTIFIGYRLHSTISRRRITLVKLSFFRKSLKGYKSIRHAEQTKDSLSSHGDIAVYELTEDVPFYKEIYPICLGDYKTEIDEEFDFYGFGADGSASPAYILKHAKLNSVGDSGGGLVYTRHSTKSVVAVASFIKGTCQEKNVVEVFGEDGIMDYLVDVRPHLYWICEATGICANKDVEADVTMWTSLPNKNRERFVTYSAKDEFDIFV